MVELVLAFADMPAMAEAPLQVDYGTIEAIEIYRASDNPPINVGTVLGGIAGGRTASRDLGARERNLTTSDAVDGTGRSASPQYPRGFAITVRLFPHVHGAVLEELAHVPCGSRSARVIHLVTIGLMYERAYGSMRGDGSVSPAASAIGSETAEMRGQDLSFVSALMNSAEG